MRIGSSVLLQNGYCYQSYIWNKLRPLGYLQNILDSFEEYQSDEISIIRPIRSEDNEESFLKDIEILKSIKSLTPISFGGGLREKKHIDMLHQLPIERLIFSSAYFKKDEKLLTYAKELFGNQAIQALLPFKIENDEILIFNSQENIFVNLCDFDLSFLDDYSNEVILLDTLNEGLNNSFDEKILNMIGIDKSKLIISGGIGEQTIARVRNSRLASVLVDNKTLHNEYSMKDYKNAK